MREGEDIDWCCSSCPASHSDIIPDAESTRIDADATPPIPVQAFILSSSDVTTSNTEHSATDRRFSLESSLQDPDIQDDSATGFAVTYQIVEQCTKRGRHKLIDNRGYSFNVQRRRGAVTDWQCTVRPKLNPCRATVRQCGSDFQPGLHIHNHPAQVGAVLAAKVTASVKAKAVGDVFKPASVIVDEVMIFNFVSVSISFF